MSAGAAGGHPGARWALMAGNFAIGCGVMVVPGALNDLARSLAVPVAAAGQLITAAAWAMALAAPLLAATLSGWDRRVLLTFSLAWYAGGHLLAAAMPNLAALLPVRAVSVLAAALFTPQAAAAIGAMVPPAQRGGAIMFIFLGWSLASVLGLPIGSYVAETAGWRFAFVFVAVLAAVAAIAVWRALPRGQRPVPLTLDRWREAFTNPALMAIVAVTALSATGQFTLFSYLAPYYRQVLGADAAAISALFLWFGAFGLAGNVLMSRWIDRLGPGVAASLGIAAMALTLLAWPAATTVMVTTAVIVPWALGCFSSNSAQQARLAVAAPALAPAMIALNTSAMYLGQGLGSAGGGLMLAWSGWGAMNAAAVAWMALALALSVWLVRHARRGER